MVQIFPLIWNLQLWLFICFQRYMRCISMYKIAKNCIIRSFSLCNLYRFISIKNKGINFGLPRLAIVVWLGILIYIMVKHAVDLQWRVVTVSNQIESLVQSRNDTSVIFNAVNLTGKKWNFLFFFLFFNWCLLMSSAVYELAVSPWIGLICYRAFLKTLQKVHDKNNHVLSSKMVEFFALSPKREWYKFQLETSERFCCPLKFLCLRNCNSSACQPDFFQIVIHVKHIRLMRKTFP